MRGKCLLKYRCKLKNTFSIVENFKIKNKKIKKGEGEVLVTNFKTLKNSSASFLCIQETYTISTISQFESD
jgi:NADH/NAD ratio-sensing transcriptional regulator Rex